MHMSMASLLRLSLVLWQALRMQFLLITIRLCSQILIRLRNLLRAQVLIHLLLQSELHTALTSLSRVQILSSDLISLLKLQEDSLVSLLFFTVHLLFLRNMSRSSTPTAAHSRTLSASLKTSTVRPPRAQSERSISIQI